MTNQDITGLTLAAIAFDALENGSETDNGLPDAVRNAAFAENLYGVAAIGSTKYSFSCNSTPLMI